MVDGSALHGDLEMEERIERDFPVAGKIDSRTLTEVLTVLVHPFNFRQQDLLDFFRISHSVPPLVRWFYPLTKGPRSLPLNFISSERGRTF